MAGTIELDELLKKSTDAVSSSASDFLPEEEGGDYTEQTRLQVDTDDFEEEEPETGIDAEEGEEPKAQSKEMLMASARRIISFVNKAQKPLLVKAYRSKYLKEGDEDYLNEQKVRGVLDNEARLQQEIENDPNFKNICKRFNHYTELIEAIEFTDDERESLEEPLAEVLAKWNKFQMSPEMALVLAVAMVMLPRIEPLFPKLFKGVNI